MRPWDANPNRSNDQYCPPSRRWKKGQGSSPLQYSSRKIYCSVNGRSDLQANRTTFAWPTLNPCTITGARGCSYPTSPARPRVSLPMREWYGKLVSCTVFEYSSIIHTYDTPPSVLTHRKARYCRKFLGDNTDQLPAPFESTPPACSSIPCPNST